MKSTPFEQPRTRAVFLSSFIFRLSSAHWRALVLAPCLLHPVPARGLLLAAFALLLASCSEPETGLTGTIEYDEVQLSATAFETVVELNVDEGTVVEKGAFFEGTVKMRKGGAQGRPVEAGEAPPVVAPPRRQG